MQNLIWICSNLSIQYLLGKDMYEIYTLCKTWHNCITQQCSEDQYSVVQYSKVKFSIVQCSAVHNSGAKQACRTIGTRKSCINHIFKGKQVQRNWVDIWREALLLKLSNFHWFQTKDSGMFSCHGLLLNKIKTLVV